MYCPNCGKENLEKQKFCRSCGLGLQVISRALVDELSTARPDDGSIEIAKGKQSRWHNPLVYGFLMLMLGMLIVIFGKKIIFEQQVADIGMLIVMLSIGLLGYKGLSLLMSGSDSSHLEEEEEEEEEEALPEQGVQTNPLPPALPAGAPPSVTEHTTRQFEPVYNKRKAE